MAYNRFLASYDDVENAHWQASHAHRHGFEDS